MRFLMIEDDRTFGDRVRAALTEQGYLVDVTQSGREGEEKAADQSYDCIVLDLMLGDHDGLQICRNLRRRRVATPILVLSALSDTSDKVTALNNGADDYLTKPVELEELLAHIRALLRRGKAEEGARLAFADLEMDLLKRSVTRAGKSIKLTSKEFALLEYFMRHPNHVLSRSLIGERVWDLAFEEESNVIEVFVSRLRNKIDKGFDRRLLHTVIGTGYIFREDNSIA
jgi:DNA-binding response OmpR family regulator